MYNDYEPDYESWAEAKHENDMDLLADAYLKGVIDEYTVNHERENADMQQENQKLRQRIVKLQIQLRDEREETDLFREQHLKDFRELVFRDVQLKLMQPLTRHFNCKYSENALEATFNNFVKGGYLHPDNLLNDWLWTCTGKAEKTPTKPLVWTKSQNALGFLVSNYLCLDEKEADWQTTAYCFVIDKNGRKKAPNPTSISHHPRNFNVKEKERLLNLLVFK